MMLPTGKPASKRSRAPRAFTLIELIVVMTLLLVVAGVSFPSLKNFFHGRTLDAEARRLLSLTRYGQSRAVTEGIPMILWFDTREAVYGLQAQTGYLDLDRKAVEYDLAEGLELRFSSPPALPRSTASPQRRATAAALNQPEIRFAPDGAIEDTSPETIEIRQQPDQAIWITQSANRLNYEIRLVEPRSNWR